MDGANKPSPSAGKAANSAQAAAGAGGLGLGAWWNNLTSQRLQAAQAHAQAVHKKVAGIKWKMPVDVKVDFLRPTAEAVQESLTAVWVQLPPPVQLAAPYVGVAVGSGLVVYALQQRRVAHHRQRREELGVQVAALQRDKEELLRRVDMLNTRSGTPRGEVEARMAVAIAQATNAAAAAADAAARAATACIYRPPPSPGASP